MNANKEYVYNDEPPYSSISNFSYGYTLLKNSMDSIKPIESMLKRVKLKLKSKAYLHWYEKYNITEEDFKEAFKYVEDTVFAYQNTYM